MLAAGPPSYSNAVRRKLASNRNELIVDIKSRFNHSLADKVSESLRRATRALLSSELSTFVLPAFVGLYCLLQHRIIVL